MSFFLDRSHGTCGVFEQPFWRKRAFGLETATLHGQPMQVVGRGEKQLWFSYEEIVRGFGGLYFNGQGKAVAFFDKID